MNSPMISPVQVRPAAADSASSPNTSTASTFAASYSGSATLVRSITILATKLPVCESSAYKRS